MILSRYILDNVNLLLDGGDDLAVFKPQVEYLSEKNREYTPMGLFVYFSHSSDILRYAIPDHKYVINGVKIFSTAHNLEGEAQLFLKDGVIDYLEIVYYNGDFPEADLDKYTLKQVWKDSPAKEITTE